MEVPPMDSFAYKQWQMTVIRHEENRILRHWHNPQYTWYPDRVVVERYCNVTEVAKDMKNMEIKGEVVQ